MTAEEEYQLPYVLPPDDAPPESACIFKIYAVPDSGGVQLVSWMRSGCSPAVVISTLLSVADGQLKLALEKKGPTDAG